MDTYRNRRRWRSAWASFLIVSLCGGARAADPASPPADKAADKPKSKAGRPKEQILEVTVTAQRTAGTVFNTSRATTVVDGASLARSAPQTTPDALRFQAGVAIQQTTPGQGSPYIRGMTGREVLHLVDGVRLNNALFRSGPNQYLAYIDPYNVHRLEVVRGSSSVLFGSDALGGVIQVLTPLPSYRRPDAPPTRGQALQSLGSNGLSTVSRAAIEHGEDRWAVRAGVTLIHSGDIRPGQGARSAVPSSYEGLERSPNGHYAPRMSNVQEGTAYQMFAGDFAARVKLSPAVELIYRSQASHLPSVNRYTDIAPRFKREYPTNAESAARPNQRFMNSLQLAARPREGIVDEADVTVSWQRVRDDVTVRKFGETCVQGGVPTGTSVQDCTGMVRLAAASTRTQEFNRSDMLGVTSHLVSRSADRRRGAIVGADVYLDRVGSSAEKQDMRTFAVTPASARYPDGSTVNTYGVFGQGDWEFIRTVRATVGARASLFDIDVKSRENPGRQSDPGFSKTFFDFALSAGLHWEFLPGVALVGNVGRGVRAPSIDDFANLGARDNGRYEVPNSGIRPESSLSFDGGFKLRHRSARGEIFLFHTTYNDKIVVAPTQWQGQAQAPTGERYYHSINASSVELNGLEVFLDVALIEQLGLFGNLMGMRGVQKNPPDAQLPAEHPADRIPPATLVTGLWARPVSSLRLEFFSNARAAQTRLHPNNVSDPRIPPGGTPGYVTLHARASWLASSLSTIHLTVDNITNRLVQEHGSGFYLPGLNVIGTIELRSN
jgi:outer membrane receptor protein involved in Fe transport